MEIGELLDRAKSRANLASDYALAKVLGIQNGIVANWRKGKRHPSNQEAIQLATLAGLDEMQVIAEIELRTANNEKKREFWKHYIESRGIAACLTMTALAFSVTLTNKEAEASILQLQNYATKDSALARPENNRTIHYAKKRLIGLGTVRGTVLPKKRDFTEHRLAAIHPLRRKSPGRM